MADLRYYVDGGWVSGWSKVFRDLVDLYASAEAPGFEQPESDASDEEEEGESPRVAPGKLTW